MYINAHLQVITDELPPSRGLIKCRSWRQQIQKLEGRPPGTSSSAVPTAFLPLEMSSGFRSESGWTVEGMYLSFSRDQMSFKRSFVAPV